MRILFLLSCLEPAGSETYCVSLARAWGDRHELAWVSDRLHFGQTPFVSMPISRKAIPGGLLNTARVAALIRRERIDLVHSHSRRAHWVASQAARLTGIPHVTTVHQPPPVHVFSRLFPCLGDRTIAIDEAVAEHLLREFRLPASQIRLIRNGISVAGTPVPPSREEELPRVLLLGRLSGGRWPAFRFFAEVLETLAPNLPAARYELAGMVPPEHATELTQILESLNRRMAPSRIESIGFTQDLPSLVRSARGIIAGGRSALESLACSRPVILMGEGGVLGLCQPAIWQDAMRTNLGDHLTPKDFSRERLENGLRQLLGDAHSAAALGEWGRTQVEKYYDIDRVADAVNDVYEELCTSRS